MPLFNDILCSLTDTRAYTSWSQLNVTTASGQVASTCTVALFTCRLECVHYLARTRHLRQEYPPLFPLRQ